jgi:hypothetical protein
MEEFAKPGRLTAEAYSWNGSAFWDTDDEIIAYMGRLQLKLLAEEPPSLIEPPRPEMFGSF